MGHLKTLAILCLLLPAASAQAGDPLRVRDDLGHEVRLSQPARRIIALAPSAVETLYALGAGEQLIATVAEADYPPEARSLPRVGTWLNPDLEKILAQRPDLVVVVRGNPPELARQLRERGIAVYVSNPERLRDVLRGMAALGVLTARTAESRQEMEAVRRRLTDVRRQVADRPPVRAAVLIWDNPVTIAGGGTFLHEVLDLAGGVNAGEEFRETYPRLDPERFLRLDPEVILVPEANAARLNRIATRPGIRGTEAAKNGKLFPVNGDWLQRPGPRLIDAIEELARVLHPDAFQR